MSRIRAVRAGLAVALTTGVLTACAEIPNSGPTTRVGGGIESEEDLVEVDPGGPRPGASPTEVVTAFIEAMQATPLTTEFAEQFLTKDAATDWDPSREVVVYEGFETTPIGQTVDVEVQRQATLNWRGAYRAVRTDEASEIHRYLLRQEAGEWRITNPINAFYVADYTFANSYLPYSLYYFAPSADALVPYPIYLPTGDQRATSLLQGVLADPPAQQGQQPLTAVPPDTTNDGSVSITTEGIAEIGLKGGALLGLDLEQRRLLSAQLVTTVSQVSGVNGVRLLADGAPWEIPGDPAVQDVELWRDFDPAELPSRAQLFALDAGRLVEISESVDADSNLANNVGVRRPDSQWASRDWGIRSFDVDLELKRVLAVTDDGGSLRTGRLYSAKGQTTERIYDQGTNLGQPVATRGREWLVVDRLPAGSRLLVVTKDNDVRALPFGPLRGERVSSLSLSPDGTRFAAVAQRIGRNGLEAPRVVLGQIRFAGDGTSVSGVETVHDLVTSGDELRDVNSVAWVDATTIGVLGSLNGAAVAPYTVRIDGSQLVNEWILPTELGLPRTLVPSVSSEGGVFVRSASGRLWYEADGEWEQVANRPLSSPTFPG